MITSQPAMDISYDGVRDARDVAHILELQRLNHRSAVDAATAVQQGFTSVQHDPEVLLAMNRDHPAAIARAGADLAGYCLMMPRSFQSRVPELQPMFQMLDRLVWRNKPMHGDPRWFVMGQVCVAAAYRGIGVFDGLYQQLRTMYVPSFDFVVTEISGRNGRSLRAHRRVGFETVHVYDDPTAEETWHVVIWDWR